MKKALVIIIVNSFFFNAFTQTEKGNFLIGASTNLSFSTLNVDGQEDNSSTFSLGGNTGYFLVDDLAVLLTVGFVSTKQGSFSSTNFRIGPALRYYATQSLFVSTGFGYNTSRTESGASTGSFSSTSFGFGAGYALWVSEIIAIEPSISYLFNTSEDSSDFTNLGFDIGFVLYP